MSWGVLGGGETGMKEMRWGGGGGGGSRVAYWWGEFFCTGLNIPLMFQTYNVYLKPTHHSPGLPDLIVCAGHLIIVT
jgi:hypothetical protein